VDRVGGIRQAVERRGVVDDQVVVRVVGLGRAERRGCLAGRRRREAGLSRGTRLCHRGGRRGGDARERMVDAFKETGDHVARAAGQVKRTVPLPLEREGAVALLFDLGGERHGREEHGLLRRDVAAQAVRNDLREFPVDQLREVLHMVIVARGDHAVRLASDTQFNSASRRHGAQGTTARIHRAPHKSREER